MAMFLVGSTAKIVKNPLKYLNGAFLSYQPQKCQTFAISTGQGIISQSTLSRVCTIEDTLSTPIMGKPSSDKSPSRFYCRHY